MTREQIVDLCILCGCDYVSSISGMGPSTAFSWIRKSKNIEGVLRRIENNGYNKTMYGCRKLIVPSEYHYKEARELFLNPDVIRGKENLKKLI
jgi:flap endonuclease-1